MMHYLYGYSPSIGWGWMGVSWMLFPLLILVLFFLIVWWLLKNGGKFGLNVGNEDAMSILKKRLARGEITADEFKKLKKEIE